MCASQQAATAGAARAALRQGVALHGQAASGYFLDNLCWRLEAGFRAVWGLVFGAASFMKC